MNQEHRQLNSPRRKQQTNLISNIPPIQSSQVWIGLSESQQQLVVTTVTKICQTLAQCYLQQTVREGGTHERVS